MSLQENGELTPRERQLAPLKPAWAAGQSGNPNGRPKSARSKISEKFLQNFYAVWEQHGLKALEKTAIENPVDFVKVAASLIPKEFHVTELPFEGMTLDDLGDVIEAVRCENAERIGNVSSRRATKAPRKGKRGAVTYSVRP